MPLCAVLYLDPLSKSLSFRPYLARLDSKPVLAWLAERVLVHSKADRFVILYHYETERAALEEAVAGTGAELQYTPHFSKSRAVAGIASGAIGSPVALLNLGCVLAPADLLLRVAEYHRRLGNTFTTIRGLPHACSLSLFDATLLAALPEVAAKLGLSDPETAAHRMLQVQALVPQTLPMQLKTAPFDFADAYSIAPASLPVMAGFGVGIDFTLAEAAVVGARADGLDLNSTAILCALKQVEIQHKSLECQLPEGCLIRPARKASDRARVLYVSLPSAFSGGEGCLCSMIRFVDQRRFELFAITSRDGVFADTLRSLGVQVVCPEDRLPDANIGKFCYAMSVLQSLGPDVIHLNGRESLPFVAAAAACGVPVVQHTRNGDLKGFEDGLALAKSVISISQFIKREVCSLPVNPDKIRVIYDEVDSETYRPDLFSAEQCRRQLGIAADSKVALMIARVAPNKRHDVMLKAAATIQAQVPGFQLIVKGDVYGESPEHYRIQGLIQELRLEAVVKWMDFVPDIRQLMAAADLLVLCSDREGLGSCVVEAMSMQLPVVVTDTGGTHEIVESGVTGGFVVPGDNPAALSARVVELLQDAGLRRRLGASGRLHVQNHLDARISARSVMDIYDGLLTPPAGT
jgi:glycosyltransferase involved in cell wall biosynthesis